MASASIRLIIPLTIEEFRVDCFVILITGNPKVSRLFAGTAYDEAVKE
jgi:hypothetical protein